jgi:hypothetical protein
MCMWLLLTLVLKLVHISLAGLFCASHRVTERSLCTYWKWKTGYDGNHSERMGTRGFCPGGEVWIADGAVTNGTIPVHMWLSHFRHSAVPFLYRCPGTSHSHYNVRFVLSLKNIAMWARHWQCSTLDVFMVFTPNYAASDPRRNSLYVKLYVSVLCSESDMIFLCLCL